MKEPKNDPVADVLGAAPKNPAADVLAAGAAPKNPGAAELFGFVSFVRLKDEFIYSLLLSLTIGTGVVYGLRVIKKMYELSDTRLAGEVSLIDVSS